MLGAIMKKQMTRKEAQEFRTRWMQVNAAELRELRSTPIRHKFRQLAALMTSAKEIGYIRTLPSEEKEVRERWNRLRKAYHGK